MGQCYCCRCNGPTVAGPPQTSLTNNQTAVPKLHTKDHFASHVAGVATEKETHGSGRCVSKGGSALQFEAGDYSRRLQLSTEVPPHPQEVVSNYSRRRTSAGFDRGGSSSYISQSDAHVASTRSGDPFELVCVESMPANLPAGGSAS